MNKRSLQSCALCKNIAHGIVAVWSNCPPIVAGGARPHLLTSSPRTSHCWSYDDDYHYDVRYDDDDDMPTSSLTSSLFWSYDDDFEKKVDVGDDDDNEYLRNKLRIKLKIDLRFVDILYQKRDVNWHTLVSKLKVLENILPKKFHLRPNIDERESVTKN